MTPQELEREISQVRDAIRLLSSMVDGGEIHTDTSLEMSNNAFRILNAWLASAERFGWKRYPENKPKEVGDYPVKLKVEQVYWYCAYWNGESWEIGGIPLTSVLAYYELPEWSEE